MQEATLRRQHRRLGLVLAVFLGLQAASGLCLSLGDLLQSPGAATEQAPGDDDKWLEVLHFGGGTVGNAYRALLGGAVLGQIARGGLISLKIRARTKRP